MSDPTSELGASPEALPTRPTWTVSSRILFLMTAAGYWLGSRLAFELGDLSGLAAVFFIPAGITLVLLVRSPSSQWWLILAAAALVEFGSDLEAGIPISPAAGFAAANVVEPLVGATLMCRWAPGAAGLAKRRSVAAFLVGAVAIGPLVGAGIGAATDYATNSGDGWETLWQWWLGDALAVLVVGGAALAWSSTVTRHPGPPGWLFVPLMVLVAATPASTVGLSDVPLEFLTMALIIVSGGVFGARGATTAAAVAAVGTAIVLVFEESPIWMGVNDATAWAAIKAELGVATIAGLALAAEVFERQLQTESIAQADAERQSAAFTRRVLDQLVSFVTVLTPDGTVVDTNHAPLTADGNPSSDIIGRPLWEATWWNYDPSVQAQLVDAVAQAAGGAVVSYDVPMRLDDVDVWVELQISPLRNDDGIITHLIKSCTDLTERRESQLRLAATAANERETRQRVELLAMVAVNLAAAVIVDDIAESVLDDVESALGLGFRAINVVEGGEIRVHASRYPDQTGLDPETTIALDADLPGPSAIATDTTIVLNSLDELATRFPAALDAARRYGVSSIAALPIRSEETENAAALVVGAVDAGWFTPGRIDLLASIATQVGQAIRRARLHQQVVEARDREHAIAVRLQESLLPDQLVTHPDLDVAARYAAATEALTVGGDWYDTFIWPDGHIGLMVGDVVGHDLEAAATMGRLRAAVAAIVPLGPPDPVAVLDALDACAHGPDGVDMVTAACVIIDPAGGRLAYATAGHPPPLVVLPDGGTHWLDRAVSTPAGRFTTGRRIKAESAFPAGSLVVLYTDGLVERRGALLTDGLDRLSDAAQMISTRTIAARDWVDDLLVRLAEGTVDDDVAVLVARLAPVTSMFRHQFPADTGQLSDLRRHLGAWLSERGIGDVLRNDMLLAIGEAATNAVEHAYGNDGLGTVTIDLANNDDEVIVSVIDNGLWIPPVPDPRRGRGTRIMEAIATHFERATGPEGTTVTMHFSVAST